MIRFKLNYFNIKAKKPLKVGGKSVVSRLGTLVGVTDENGITGMGEAAPLHGLDDADFLECRVELQNLLRFIQKSGIREVEADFSAPYFGFFAPPFAVHPITAFGLESAILHYLAACRNFTFKKGRNPAGKKISINVNGLFIPKASLKDTEAQIKNIADSGFRTVKVKIGRIDPKIEIRRINGLWERFEGRLTLRLDANRALSFEQYRAFYAALSGVNVEYVEEPLSGGDAVARALSVPWPLALDESLPEVLGAENPDPARLPEGVSAVVLKPGSFWGVSGLVRAIEAFSKMGVKTTLSSSFNTGIGICSLGLIARLTGLGAAHGLDTLKFLESDVLPDSPRIEGGKLVIPRDFMTGRLEMAD